MAPVWKDGAWGPNTWAGTAWASGGDFNIVGTCSVSSSLPVLSCNGLYSIGGGVSQAPYYVIQKAPAIAAKNSCRYKSKAQMLSSGIFLPVIFGEVDIHKTSKTVKVRMQGVFVAITEDELVELLLVA